MRAAETVGWYARNQHPDGTWVYLVDAAKGVDLGGYNWVRHAGGGLRARAGRGSWRAGRGGNRAAGRAAIVSRLVAHGSGASAQLAVVDGPSLTTGGTALLAVALAQHRLDTGDRSDDDRLRALGHYLLSTVEADGRVDEIGDVDTGLVVPGIPGRFSTGEAMFALARLERIFPGEGWAEPARRIGRYIVRSRANDEGFVPDISDHWTAYAFTEVVQWGHDDTLSRPSCRWCAGRWASPASRFGSSPSARTASSCGCAGTTRQAAASAPWAKRSPAGTVLPPPSPRWLASAVGSATGWRAMPA